LVVTLALLRISKQLSFLAQPQYTSRFENIFLLCKESAVPGSTADPPRRKIDICEIAGASRGAGDDNSEELPIDKNGRSSGRPLLLL
jgi:hypothetical protein